MCGTGEPVPRVMLMSEQIINLLLQIPLAGVVVVVVWMFQKSQERQAKEAALSQERQTDQMINFMEQQAETNREFLRTQREQTNAALARFAEEQKGNREELAKLTIVIDRFMQYVTPVRKRNRNA